MIGLGLLVALASTGCSWFGYSSQYKPRPKPGSALRIAIRNDNLIVIGGPPGKLEEKLAAVPEAARAAATYRRRSLMATIGLLAGYGCLGVGGAIYVDGLKTDGSAYEAPLPLTLTATGCAAIVIGSWLLEESAEPYLYDAVNIYNDRIDVIRARE
jgi:hypothetical protein